MGAPFILTVLSEDGYQVFAALHREFVTIEEAIEGARADYIKRYGGTPAFRVYHASDASSGYRHTLIEACFDESKRRSFVALYKILQEVEPTPTPIHRPNRIFQSCAYVVRRIITDLRNHFPRPRASTAIPGFR
jgi:hypothetical protein